MNGVNGVHGSGIVNECALCGSEAKSRCSACQNVHYCCRDHQRHHWTIHKHNCKKSPTKSSSSSSSTSSTSSSSSAPSNGAAHDVTQGFLNADDDWWNGLSHHACYHWFIDSFRLRLDDHYTLGGSAQGVYGGESSVDLFVDYLRKAQQIKAMPPWWNTEHDTKLMTVATSHKKFNLKFAVEKEDIRESWGTMAPLALRMLAERITGTNAMMSGGDWGFDFNDDDDDHAFNHYDDQYYYDDGFDGHYDDDDFDGLSVAERKAPSQSQSSQPQKTKAKKQKKKKKKAAPAATAATAAV